jgi:hypothetical protein
MAVFFYDEGEHPSGFIGFRVVTTLGDASEFRQKYFGLTQYSYREAEHLAEKLNAKWRADAEQYLQDTRLHRTRSYGGDGVIVLGLTAGFRVERGRKAHYGTYITPRFTVNKPGHGAGSKSFATTLLGYDKAFANAVEYYCLLHGMTDKERRHVLGLKPDPALFTETLRIKLLSRGIVISREEVQAKLGVLQGG